MFADNMAIVDFGDENFWGEVLGNGKISDFSGLGGLQALGVFSCYLTMLCTTPFLEVNA